MDLTIGSKHYHVSLLALLGLALALCWYFARDTGVPVALESWWASGHQERQTDRKFQWDIRVLAGQVATHVHHEARLAQESAQKDRTIQVAQHQVDGLVSSLDSAQRAALTPAVRRIGEACGEALDLCDRRRQELAQALETEHAKSNLALARAAHADSVIARGLQVTECRWLVFPCPDRTVVAALGFMAGVLAAATAVHH